MENEIGLIWKKWDLHIHTDESDGKVSCQEILDEAVAKHIQCIAVTDHHIVANVDIMKTLAVPKPHKQSRQLKWGLAYCQCPNLMR